jgi:Rrf2 family nitric oxide-sensitive transcriptional repressor
MHLTLHTDYALRLLMYLALRPERRCTIEEVAGAYSISRNHLMKVALTLTREGFVDSLRGRSGGLQLARGPKQINLGAVVRSTEDNFTLVECFDSASNTCLLAPVCQLKRPFAEAVKAFLAVLDGYTLADLTGPPATARALGRLLGAA